MDRRDVPRVPTEADAAPKLRQRRAVMNDAWRKVERALRVADAAEELASATDAVLLEAEQDGASTNITALRSALPRYRRAGGG
jgi:hypothetical protein